MSTEPKIEPSEYERLISGDMLYSRVRRPSLTEEERKERRKAQSRLAMESRRRAVSVLITRHQEEYDQLYEGERKALELDPRYLIE